MSWRSRSCCRGCAHHLRAPQPAVVANSRFVAQRILDCYGRDAQVIHPPVDVDRFSAIERCADADAPYLVFGRVVPYKRVDVAVRACARLGRPLIVAGEGRDLDRVRALAGPQTTFLGPVRDERVHELLATSRALLFPAEEDFGIVPVEAQAAGLPVVVESRWGTRLRRRRHHRRAEEGATSEGCAPASSASNR